MAFSYLKLRMQQYDFNPLFSFRHPGPEPVEPGLSTGKPLLPPVDVVNPSVDNALDYGMAFAEEAAQKKTDRQRQCIKILGDSDLRTKTPMILRLKRMSVVPSFFSSS